MTTYEVGTTALFRGEYRERRPDGKWYNQNGAHVGSDYTAEGDSHWGGIGWEGYKKITPPGPPVSSAMVPGKRYVISDYSQPGSRDIIEWDKSRQRHTIEGIPTNSGVSTNETIREIREPGSTDLNETGPDWSPYTRLHHIENRDYAVPSLFALDAVPRSELLALQKIEQSLRREIQDLNRTAIISAIREADLRSTIRLNRDEIDRKNRVLGTKTDHIAALQDKIATARAALRDS